MFIILKKERCTAWYLAKQYSAVVVV